MPPEPSLTVAWEWSGNLFPGAICKSTQHPRGRAKSLTSLSDSAGHISIGCTAATLKGTGRKGDSRAMSLSKLQDIVNDREAWWEKSPDTPGSPEGNTEGPGTASSAGGFPAILATPGSTTGTNPPPTASGISTCAPRGNPACRGTFGGRRKAVRDRLALQGGTGDFP